MRQTLGKMLLALASALATLFLVDLVLLIAQGPVRVVENFYEPVADYGYKVRPNLTFEFANPYHGYRGTVHTNSQGLRGPNVTMPKPPGVFRILFIGDSMTAGLEVDDSDTFSAVCGHELSGAPQVESINAGVRGYNLDNVLGYLQDAGIRLEPDVVVYTFVDNDLTALPNFTPATSDWSRGSTLTGLLGRLSAYSHLTYRLDLLRQQAALRKMADTTKTTHIYVPRGLFTLFTLQQYDRNASAMLTKARIAAMDSTCRTHGARFVLAGAPHRLEVSPPAQDWLRTQLAGRADPDVDGARRYLDWVAAQVGCGRVDPIPEFRAGLEHDRDYWFHKDDHLNVLGHRKYGGILARELQRFVPPQ